MTRFGPHMQQIVRLLHFIPVPVVEVERLWKRFCWLDNGNSDGILTKARLAESHVMKDDILRKILQHFPRTETQGITFQTYCNAAKWFENANIENKSRALFKTLNNDDVIDQTTLARVMTSVYSDASQETITRNVKVLMAEIDTKKQGFIDEEQFIHWLKAMPYSSLQSLLEFSVIPQQIQDEHRNGEGSRKSERRPRPKPAPRPSPKPSEQQQPDDTPSRQQTPPRRPIAITSDIMDKVATRASGRDWHVFANRLGFTSEDIQELAVRYPRKDHEQVYAMLREWMHREGTAADVPALEAALTDSQMGDIAREIYQY
ncbi:uncharacterized protein [Ptychodera flava]|uniref:uncharacterized protein n=1 Tax=Ptychodera flava TaxID=63121 RepID=UPI003969BC97